MEKKSAKPSVKPVVSYAKYCVSLDRSSSCGMHASCTYLVRLTEFFNFIIAISLSNDEKL